MSRLWYGDKGWTILGCLSLLLALCNAISGDWHGAIVFAALGWCELELAAKEATIKSLRPAARAWRNGLGL